MESTRQALEVHVDESSHTKLADNRTSHAETIEVSNRHFRRLKNARSARHLARVQSAVALSGNLKARVRADLIRIYGPLRISFVEIPALSGGMRITVGKDLYYGSVSGALAALEDRLPH